jgi:hypothetical protein
VASSHGSGRRGSAVLAVVLLLVIAGGLRLALASHGPPPAPPSPTPPAPATPPPRPPAAWLGLNYNGDSRVGGLKDFVSRGIVYDREGRIEVNTGTTPENSRDFRAGLDTDYAVGMVPVLEIDPGTGPPGCTSAPDPSKTCLPTTRAQIDELVRSYVLTAGSVIRDYPGQRVLFEAFDEPWNWAYPPGTQAGARAASQYAAFLARLLPAARVAGIPLSDIYVAAIGKLPDGSEWLPDLYRAQPCLEPGPATCGPIEGWYLHPYGLPDDRQVGIASVPQLRTGMLSGENNLVISEIGFCALDVADGKRCDINRSDIDGTSRQTARWLTETLRQAAAMHAAGWLQALLVWERAGTGWAMQNPDGSLTAQGRALDLFADSEMGH